MKRYLLFAIFAIPGWAYSSLVVKPGVTSVLKVPAVAPFTSLGDYRVEFRIHDWSVPATGYPTYISWGSSFSGARYLEILFKTTGEICAVDWVDKPNGQQSCANLTGHTDVIVRVQRFQSGTPGDTSWGTGSFLLEAQDLAGAPIASYCNSTTAAYPCPITPATSDWSRIAGYVGNPSSSTSFSLAWLKWFSTTVPPGSPFSRESTAADLADWHFESDLNGQTAGGYAVNIGAFNSNPVYAPSPTYAPACVAGPQRVFRAGQPAKLDGTYAYSLNGDPQLTYLWQKLSGPTEILFNDGHDKADPTISRTEFGSYIFQLTVADSGGRSSSCLVKHGFVATDDNDVVITGSSAVDTLLGPMIRYGANPWPWADDRHKAGADFNSSHLTDYYKAFWEESQGPGTVAVTAGNAVVTGNGTDFTTRFCQGPDNPTVPKQAGGENAYILIWYPNASPEGYGLRYTPVASCQSDTQLTLTHAWYGDVADCRSGGCNYSYDDAYIKYSGVWLFPEGAGANFYDAVAAFYALYYRSGIDDYLTAARTLADRDWKYRLDSGTKCRYSSPYPDQCGAAIAPRAQSTLGMVLRALDGRPDMWQGLEKLFDYYMAGKTSQLSASGWGVWDTREQAYEMAILSYCALYDPDADHRTNCKSTLSYAMNNLWSQTQSPDGEWKAMYTPYTGNSWYAGKSVTLTKGSTSVVGNGTTFGSIAFMDGTWINNPAKTTHIVFFTGTAQPASNDAIGAAYYTATYVDDTHLTISPAWSGTSGDYGWAVGYSFCPNSCAVGWGAQPFMIGILGFAFEMTALAITDSDPANAARAHQYNVDLANWQKNRGYRPSIKGLQYVAGTVDCPAPIDESWTWCTSGMEATAARTLNAEALRSVTLAYGYTGNGTLKNFADTIYNAMWARPGTCPSGSTLCVPDGAYLTDWTAGSGWYMTGTPWINRWHKYFGMSFGIGASSDWPAVRIGGPQTPQGRSVHMAFNMTGVPGAVSARVRTVAPNGKVVVTPCAGSPCTITIDSRQGDHVFLLEYLAPNGTVLASTESPVIQGH